MTREELATILDSDKETKYKITEILNKHNGELESIRDERDSEVAKGIKAVEKLTELESKVNEYKQSSKEIEDYKSEIEALKESRDELENKLSSLKLSGAVELAVANAGVRNKTLADMLVKSIDMSSISFDEEGKLTGLDEQITSLKEKEDTAALFVNSEAKRQAYNSVKGSEAKSSITQGG